VNIVQGCGDLGIMASKAEILQDWGAWPSETELLQGCVGLGGMAQQRSWRGLAEIVNVCGSLALRAHPMKILQF
jgi:hypothetical protein